jgi:hypothetical protein
VEAREKQRVQRARKRGTLAPVTIANAPSTEAAPGANAPPGPCERATAAELETLPGAQTHQASAAAALCMARILDNRLALTTQPSACRQLSQVMATIRKASAAPRGRLAVIAKMVERPDAG